MSEQQRIFLAVALCLGILLLWQLVFAPTKPTPSEPAAPPPAPTAEAPKPAAMPAIAAEPASKHAPLPAAEKPGVEVAEVRRAFATERLSGELSNRNLLLTRLDLAAYNERPP